MSPRDSGFYYPHIIIRQNRKWGMTEPKKQRISSKDEIEVPVETDMVIKSRSLGSIDLRISQRNEQIRAHHKGAHARLRLFVLLG